MNNQPTEQPIVRGNYSGRTYLRPGETMTRENLQRAIARTCMTRRQQEAEAAENYAAHRFYIVACGVIFAMLGIMYACMPIVEHALLG